MIIFALTASLSLIMYLINMKYPMGTAIILGSFVLALLAGLTPTKVLNVVISALFNKNTLELVASVYLISLLGSMMFGYGVIDKMVEYLEKAFKSAKLLIFIIPSLLATFSVAGSAVFAAPIIDVLGDKVGLSKERKAAINLYIRHAWFFILPISASILYAAYLAGVSVWALIRTQAPVSIACIIASYLVYISPLGNVEIKHETEDSRVKTLGGTLLYTGPLLITLILVVWLPFYLALLAGCLFTYFIRVKKDNFRKMLVTRQGLNMVFATASIMVFKEVIDSIPGIRLLIEDVLRSGIPLEAILLVLPFVFGYILANPQALIGMLFPILLPLVPPDQVLSTAALINALGFVSYFISPLHLCQALTNEFFCVSTKNLYREYKITVPVMLAAAIVNYLATR